LFYIIKSDKAILYKFESTNGIKIYGKNPVNDGRVTIDISLYGGKISNL
jgi:hypothetical protein